ncbi:GNAT family N-acetyltransferase [archaeon]|nr:GNAT family N-acetyltransferase [archaeon]
MVFQKIKENHAKQISILIKKTFIEFVAHTFTNVAKNEFISHINEENIMNLINDYAGYVAITDSNIVGVIMAKQDKNKITALFVDKKHHHKGIATKLVNKIISDFKKQGAKSIRCWASFYAVPFYQHQGFKKTRGVVKTKKGYTYQPMKKIIC